MGNQITRSNGDYTTTRTHETTAMANTYHASARKQKRHRRVAGGKYKDRANAGGGYVYDADEHADMRRGVRLPT